MYYWLGKTFLNGWSSGSGMSFSMLINDTAKELYSVNLDDIFYISALCSVVLLIYLPTSNIIHVPTYAIYY